MGGPLPSPPQRLRACVPACKDSPPLKSVRKQVGLAGLPTRVDLCACKGFLSEFYRQVKTGGGCACRDACAPPPVV